MMQRWKLTLEYDGRTFNGWQRQAEPHVVTVQGCVEETVYKFCQQNITVHVAGRTDAGVHAQGQVCHFDLDYGDRALDGFTLAKALNALIRPHKIVVLHAEKASDDFHARFSAINKLYRYQILCRPAPPALLDGRVWHIFRALDVEAMRAGASHLIGYHDFSSFRSTFCQAKTPMRTLDAIRFSQAPIDSCGGALVVMETESRSFLHHQVRNMIGTLAQVGMGKMAPDDVRDILSARSRDAAGPTAPPDGLSLVRIDYA